jgi:hypothetical protein
MKYLLVLNVSIFFFALTYSNSAAEFLAYDLIFIIGLLTIVFGLEVLIARLFARNQIAQNLILAGFTTINILYLNLVLSEAFLGLPKYGQLLSLLLALFILNTFMNMLDDNARIAKVLPALFVLGTAGVLMKPLLAVVPVSVLATEPEKGKTSAANIRIVDFKTKPNVYFISFDAMIPKVLLKKYLDLETTPYHEVLDTHFRPFKNAFADRTPTRPSLNSLLSLDMTHFSEAQQRNEANYFFPGLIPSPLLEIFKHNGYETTTVYRSLYFGKKKGPYVDNYISQIVGWDLKMGICEFIAPYGLMAPTFMGYCAIVKSNKFIWGLRVIGRAPTSQQASQVNALINLMRGGLKKRNPHFVLAYLFSPGHTESSFDMLDDQSLNEYRQAYLAASKITATHLDKIVSFISNEDPEAIVYIFGDHGAWMSRRDSIENNATFFVQDRFGVYAGVYPPDRCAESFTAPYNKDFVTVVQGAHMIIRCLTGGENAFINLEDYYLPILNSDKDQYRYVDYLYE